MIRSLFTAVAALCIALPAIANAETILITGSNRGIGLGLAEAYAERGWRVIATARDPSRAEELNALAAKYETLTVEELDVTDDAEIAALAAKYDGTAIDVLLNNAGVLGDIEKQNAQNIDYDEIKFIMDVNV
jgi:NAD(P)-dependent dehydrogenase (short-subunit alcohol dehydrogenase family)